VWLCTRRYERIAKALIATFLAGHIPAAQNDTPNAIIRARQLVEQGQFDQASAILLRILRADPYSSEAQYDLGVIAARQNRPADALTRFETVLRRNPDNIPALSGALDAQLQLKQHAAARSTARRLAALIRPSDPLYYQIAGLLATNGEYMAAIPMLEKVHELSPANYEVTYNLGLAYFRAGRLDSALHVITPFATNAEAADLRGAIEQKRDNAPEALKAYRLAVDLEPSNEGYRADLGAVLLECGKTGDAIKLFRDGLKLNPESWRMRLGLGSALYIAGQYEDSAAALLEAAQRRPGASILYVLLAKAYDSAPALQAQIAATIESHVREEDNDASLHLSYGNLLYSRRDFVAARLAYQKALKLDPTNAEAHLQLGMTLQAEGDPSRALSEFERAVQANPRLASAHYRLGLAYQKLGRTRKAQVEMAAFRELKARGADDANDIVKSLRAH
jgi:superkiller protein 3